METRYGTISRYNRVKVLNEVEKMIDADGGEILHGKKEKMLLKAYTNDRDEAKRKLFDELPPVEKWGYKYSSFGESLSFIINEYFFNISYDENPFFPITFTKIKIDEAGGYIGKRYSDSNEEINERQYKKDGTFAFSFGYDNLFKICNEDEILSMAEYHYEQMKKSVINGRESEIYNEKRRVKNYYNSGYHYEKIYDKTPCNVYGAEV